MMKNQLPTLRKFVIDLKKLEITGKLFMVEFILIKKVLNLVLFVAIKYWTFNWIFTSSRNKVLNPKFNRNFFS